jgi:hypothetical protein
MLNKKFLLVCLSSVSTIAIGMKNNTTKPEAASLKETINNQILTDKAAIIKLFKAKCLEKYSDYVLRSYGYTTIPNEKPCLYNGKPYLNKNGKPLYRINDEPSDLVKCQRNLLCERWAELYSKMGTNTSCNIATEIHSIEKMLEQMANEALAARNSYR